MYLLKNNFNGPDMEDWKWDRKRDFSFLLPSDQFEFLP